MDYLAQQKNYMKEAFIRKVHETTIFFDLEKANKTDWKYVIMKNLHGFKLKGGFPEFINNFFQAEHFGFAFWS